MRAGVRPMMCLPQAVLVFKNGRSLGVRLKTVSCRFGGEPAVLVTLSYLDSQASDDSWDAELDDFFASEVSPFALQILKRHPCFSPAVS
jgi:hypothetical protein